MTWKFTRTFLISAQGSHVCLCPHLRTETRFSYDIRDVLRIRAEAPKLSV